jgi:hypothetical protein
VWGLVTAGTGSCLPLAAAYSMTLWRLGGTVLHVFIRWRLGWGQAAIAGHHRMLGCTTPAYICAPHCPDCWPDGI